MAKTYVLAGYDHNGVFKDSLDALAKRDDVVIIRPKPNQSVAEAIAEANKSHPIGQGDNIIIDAHGSKDGRIEWNQGELVPYADVFEGLPKNKGIATIAVASCYGEMAQRDLQHAPNGAVVVSLVGTQAVGRWSSITQFSKELNASSNTVDIMLQALDNVDPKQLAELAARDNGQAGTSDPNRILPHTVGIGGHPPEKLDLNVMLQLMGNAGKQHTLDAGIMGSAALRVAQSFDTTRGVDNGGMVDEIKLKAEIASVANKIQSGTPLEGIEEKRIGYALAISYMDKSGELQQLIDKAKGTHAPEHAVAAQAPVQEVAHTPTVEDVQKFLNNVGVPGADGQPLVVDGQVGNNTLTAFHAFCNEHGLNPREGAGPEFQKMMQAFEKGTLTKGELEGIKADKLEVDRLVVGLSKQQQQDIRQEFAGLRATMMGSNNEQAVEAKMDGLVATITHAVDAANQANSKGGGRYA